MKNIFGKISVFKTLILSFALIVFIPTTATLFVSLQYYDKVSEEIEQMGNNNAKSVLQELESYYENAATLTYKLASDSEITQYAGGFSDITKKMFSEKDIIGKMSAYADFSLFSDMYIYLPRQQSVITNVVKFSPDQFFLHYVGNNYKTQSDWEKALHINDNLRIEKGYRKQNGKQIDSIVFTRSVLTNNRYVFSGSIVVFVDISVINTVINKNNAYDDKFILYKGDNEFLTSNMSKKEFDYLTDKLKNFDSDKPVKIGNINYSCKTFKSSVSDWQLVFLQNSDSLKQLKITSTLWVVLCGVSSVVLSLIFCYLLAKRNYTPIKRIISTLTGHDDLVVNSIESNEYQYILDTFQKVINKSKMLESTMERQGGELKSLFISNILKGKILGTTEVATLCKFHSMTFCESSFAVLLLSLNDDETDLFFESRQNLEQSIGDSYHLIPLIMKNVVEEMLQKIGNGYLIEIDNNYACIFSTTFTSRDDYDQKLHKLSCEIQAVMKENFGIVLSIFYSDPFEKLANAFFYFNKLVEAQESASLIYSEYVVAVSVNDFSKRMDEDKEFLFLPDEEQMLANQLHGNNFSDAQVSCERIFKLYFTNSSLNQTIIKFRMTSIVQTVLRALYEKHDWVRLKDLDIENCINNLYLCRNVKLLRKDLFTLFKMLDKINVQEFKQNQEQSIYVIKAMDIVQSHYTDDLLSVSQIADKLDVNASYLSRIFAEQSGTGLLEYIHRFRVNAAINLLNDKNYSVYSVAKKVGFNNVNSFIRTFKKITGTTPKQYRQIHGEDELSFQNSIR